MSIPIAYLSLGIQPLVLVYLIRSQTESFALTGTVVSAPLVGAAATASLQGRVIDRYGPVWVIPALTAAHVLLLGMLILALEAELPSIWPVTAAASAGACFPQLTATARTLWMLMLPDTDSRQAAYALVAVSYQLALVAGPVLAAMLLAVAPPLWALLAACVLLIIGTVCLITAPAVRLWVPAEARSISRWGVLGSAGVRIALFTSATTGFSQGVLILALPAFAISRQSLGAAGTLLAILSAATTIGSFLYGGMRWRQPLIRQWVAGQCGLSLMLAFVAVAGSAVVMAVPLAVAGLLFGAISVVVLTIMETVAPSGRLTEAFTVSLTAALLGNAGGRALAGVVLEEGNFMIAIFLAAVVVLVGGGAVLLTRRALA